MGPILALGLKDLRLLFRVKARLFFTLIWPLLLSIMFGLIFGGTGPRQMRLALAVVDEDNTSESRAFAEKLDARPGMDVAPFSRAAAIDEVRRGRRIAAVILPQGFGEARGRMFYGAPPRVELAIDPSRQTEAGMLQGLLFEQGAQAMQQMMSDPARMQQFTRTALAEVKGAPAGEVADRDSLSRFLTELDRFTTSRQAPAASAGASGGGSGAPGPQWQPLEVVTLDIARDMTNVPHSGFDITFVQGMIWGLMGCAMTFAVGLVSERTHGTFVRLQMAPLTSTQILLGKAIACYVTLFLLQILILAVGTAFFGLRVGSPGLMAIAMLFTSTAFVGVMMLIASLGKTEDVASGIGWAIMMPMSMLGGAMVPLIAMPAWMITAGHVSPIKWAILALEGAVWRGFGPTDMLLPCGILLAVGAVTFGVGVRALR
jgi:ABC-2 type transport system permease protein